MDEVAPDRKTIFVACWRSHGVSTPVRAFSSRKLVEDYIDGLRNDPGKASLEAMLRSPIEVIVEELPLDKVLTE